MFISKQICPIKARKDILAFMVAIEREERLFAIPLHLLGSIPNLPLKVGNGKLYYIFKKERYPFYYLGKCYCIIGKGITLYGDLLNAQLFIEDQMLFCIKHNCTPPAYKILRCYIPKNTLYFKSYDERRYRPERLIIEKVVDIPTK